MSDIIGRIYKFYDLHWIVINEMDRSMAGLADQSRLFRHYRLSCMEDATQIDVLLSIIENWMSKWKRVA